MIFMYDGWQVDLIDLMNILIFLNIIKFIIFIVNVNHYHLSLVKSFHFLSILKMRYSYSIYVVKTILNAFFSFIKLCYGFSYWLKLQQKNMNQQSYAIMLGSYLYFSFEFYFGILFYFYSLYFYINRFDWRNRRFLSKLNYCSFIIGVM